MDTGTFGEIANFDVIEANAASIAPATSFGGLLRLPGVFTGGSKPFAGYTEFEMEKLKSFVTTHPPQYPAKYERPIPTSCPGVSTQEAMMQSSCSTHSWVSAGGWGGGCTSNLMDELVNSVTGDKVTLQALNNQDLSVVVRIV